MTTPRAHARASEDRLRIPQQKQIKFHSDYVFIEMYGVYALFGGDPRIKLSLVNIWVFGYLSDREFE